MTDVLARIVARKKQDVAARLGGQAPVAQPTTRSLKAALARPGARFVMEVKRASPSGHRSPVSVEQAARAYAPLADAISVLTDGPDFGGDLADIARVRAHFDGPILAKDFIVAAAQVAEARAAGADAVLVMLSVLDDREAREVLDAANALAMDSIVEVHDEAEMARAVRLAPAIIGINNRDLKSLGIDLSTTERLARLAPAGALLISESGIASRADVLALAPHVDAFLVGSALMAAPDIAEAARALVHGRVKLCGLTHADDVALAARSGASHAGLIFVPGTPRALTDENGQELAGLARRLSMKSVGVFRDCPLAQVIATARRLGLDAVQLHGSEPDAYLAELRQALPATAEIWAVSSVGEGPPLMREGADRILFDTPKDSAAPIALSLVEGHPALPSGFIAGALTTASAPTAAALGAYGIDLCSGVEKSPGRKDPAKVAALFDALRPAVRGEER
jgi:indole-3-glycerol phosphate synthase/phosphoribosylanthranilate isomerase